MKYIPRWSMLHRAYGGLIGTALFLISLASPLAFLFSAGLELNSARWFLSGAAIIAMGFILEQIFIPDIPKEFSSRESYANSLLARHEKQALDSRFEFDETSRATSEELKQLIKNTKLPNDLEIYFASNDKTPQETLGDEKAIYYGGLVNFEFQNSQRNVLRLMLALMFVIGTGLIYCRTISALISLIHGDVNGNS